jgi:hypothetical protein
MAYQPTITLPLCSNKNEYAEEMESSSKIDLKDVSWWKSIKDACRHRVPIIVRLSKEGCISIVVRRRPFHTTCK